MGSITAVQISNYLDVDYVGSDVEFNSISTDSRTLEPGALFVAIHTPPQTPTTYAVRKAVWE